MENKQGCIGGEMERRRTFRQRETYCAGSLKYTTPFRMEQDAGRTACEDEVEHHGAPLNERECIGFDESGSFTAFRGRSPKGRAVFGISGKCRDVPYAENFFILDLA
jgi:hypothetical protein